MSEYNTIYHCTTCGYPISMNAPICLNCGNTQVGSEAPGCFQLLVWALILAVVAMIL
jgi:hypothetical protein